MARRTHDDALGVAGAQTIIGAGVVVKGDLKSQSDITVDAQLNGNITTTGDITIGVNAKVEGTIRGGNVLVAGTLLGDIHAAGLATIRETGQVQGNITAEGLEVASGGIFVGRSTMPIPPELPTPSSDTDDEPHS
jgi:cytoskeletal protein CcmA (bactofilin family)